ncbi:MAG: S-methyl-5-thioribose-1-phosphate isomerase, partial [Syntrophales bacterium]|nr:S-methyl-5-thioribose-1-phosphate isomerase [Syntrophales bacterium]
MEIKTVYWEDDAVVMVDQRALPEVERLVVCRDYRDVCAAIRDLTVRGAPAIGVAAAFGIALGARGIPADNRTDWERAFREICLAFAETRPTARNLFWAIERMEHCFANVQAGGGEGAPFDPEDIKARLLAEAERIRREDVEINRRIGINGRDLIADGDGILTHCNAGALATAGYGTALGIIRAAHEEGKRMHVFIDETRPVLQGARLTAWELGREGIPATLITDNMAGLLMKQGKIAKVITGADRIAANGDTANKIGTYSVAVLAAAHGIPFYVAAPSTTFDLSIASGQQIPIEERSPEE